jgi:hypothetical protein
MIPDLGGIIEETSRTRFDNFLQGQLFVVRVLDEVVGVVDIRLVVFAVVVVQCFRGHIGGQRVARVRQLR